MTRRWHTSAPAHVLVLVLALLAGAGRPIAPLRAGTARPVRGLRRPAQRLGRLRRRRRLWTSSSASGRTSRTGCIATTVARFAERRRGSGRRGPHRHARRGVGRLRRRRRRRTCSSASPAARTRRRGCIATTARGGRFTDVAAGMGVEVIGRDSRQPSFVDFDGRRRPRPLRRGPGRAEPAVPQRRRALRQRRQGAVASTIRAAPSARSGSTWTATATSTCSSPTRTATLNGLFRNDGDALRRRGRQHWAWMPPAGRATSGSNGPSVADFDRRRRPRPLRR